ncbi:MAG: DUF4397 domain-containing protein [Gammaproteobacteria bacterium]|nr:DUF4397 domain-containing protein [Gammaproteobacteria bacterium]NNL50542.1 DUF4397 domain-containing protein [Woeseiaceae bacterium]
MSLKSLLLLLLGTVILASCGNESDLPDASGKASVRAINAIPTSAELVFLIEERVINTAAYAAATSSVRYDDLEYTFNIDVGYAGETSRRRIASQLIDVAADRDYTLLVSGTLSDPSITVWESDERNFDEAETVFQVRFAHSAESLGTLDYYFADASVPPVLGNQVATLSFGDITAPLDLEGGDFVLTITAAGDPDTVMFVSGTETFAARGAYIITPFDAGPEFVAPTVVGAINTLASGFSLPDSRFPPAVEFVNAAIDLGTSDVFDDETLMSKRVSDLAYLDVSEELEVSAGVNSFFFTPAGDTAAITLESTLSAFGGVRYRQVAVGTAPDFLALTVIPDRRPVETHAKFSLLHTSNNFDFLDFYLVEADTSIDDVLPRRAAIAARVPSSTIALAPGSYDIYATEFAEKTPLAGPYRIDVTVGDIVDMIIVDTVDPVVLDALFLSGGPAP